MKNISNFPTLVKQMLIVSGSVFLSVLLMSKPAAAQGFSAVISPPRFELKVTPGKTIRQVIEITHAANQLGRYRVYTNDWVIGSDGNAIFSDELAANSCRPWVSLERRELMIAANGKMRFRFEITPPQDAASRECRFAVMIEGLEQVIKTEGEVSFPVSGRVGVVVYAAVGGASSTLEISSASAAIINGQALPQLSVRNTGNAHGRLGGFVVATDSEGAKVDMTPETVPILPNTTRLVSLVPNVPENQQVRLKYPLTVKGDIEWGEKKTAIDMRFDAPIALSKVVESLPVNPQPLPVVPNPVNSANPANVLLPK